MNYLHTILLSAVLASWIIVCIDTTSLADWKEDLKATIHQVAKDYRKEQWFDGQCYIGSTPVTLAQMLYGLWVAEGGFVPWSAWLRTNNPWSLHKPMWLKKVVGTHQIDNTKWRPEYATMYDWLYEKAHLIASTNFRYKCNYTFEAAFCYVNGCKAERTEERKQRASNQLNNALRWAMKFTNSDAVLWTTESAPTENLRQKAKDQEERTKQLTDKIKKDKEQLVKEEAKTIIFWWDYIRSK